MSGQQQDFLLVDDDPALTAVLQRALSRRGYSVQVAHTIDQALISTGKYQFARALLDLKLAQDSGLKLLQELKQRQPSLAIVILTGYSSVATAVEAIKAGALNYLCKPADVPAILAAFELEPQDNAVIIPDNPPSIDRLEWEHIQRVLQENRGNISATARSLGMHRRTLQRKLQKRPVKS